MKRELRDKWVAALRSGKYEQGQKTLVRDNRYCCLGVLCDVAGWSDPRIGLNDTGLYQGSRFERDKYLGLELFGLPEQQHETLWRMNDGEQDGPASTFAEIADWIEENVNADDRWYEPLLAGLLVAAIVAAGLISWAAHAGVAQ